MPSARSVALDALAHVTTDKIEVDEALARTGFNNLPALDKSFAYTLVMACLRWGRAADHILMDYMETLLPERKQHAKWAMRMGVVQLRVLGVPDHAAVSETVDIIKARKGDAAYVGLANAVLKKVAQERPPVQSAKAFVQHYEQSWCEAYGAEDYRAMAEAMVEEPYLDITVPKDIYRFEKELNATKIGEMTLRLPPDTTGGDVRKLPGYAEGAWWVQDAAAALPVQLLGNVRGLDILDLCAAPGGKTAQLIAAGAKVTSVDRSPARIRRLKENMQRLKMEPEIIDADILKWTPKKQYDAILLDAPCSATGTFRRHPEIGWIRNPREGRYLVGTQRDMMEKVWEWLKPGGRFIYAVCSLEQDEGEKQVEWFTGKHRNAQVVRPQMTPGIVPQEAWNLQNMLRILPHYNRGEGGYDGFFAACIVKTA